MTQGIVNVSLWLLMTLCFTSLSVAQPAPLPADISEDVLQRQIDELSQSIAKVRGFAVSADAALDSRQLALRYRQDDLAIAALNSFVKLCRRTLDLDPGSAQRAELIGRLAALNESLDEVYMPRLGAVEGRINRRLQQLGQAEAADRLAKESIVGTLNDQRIAYLSAMVDTVPVRRKLDLPEGRLGEHAGLRLTEFAQELIGAIDLHVNARRTLLAQTDRVKSDEVLKQALALQRQAIAVASTRLEQVVEQLERLDLDTTEARGVLLRQSRSVSVSLLDAAILGDLVSDIESALAVWLKDEAFDTVFQILLFVLIVVAARVVARTARAAVAKALHSGGNRMSMLLKDVLVSMVGALVLTIGILVALSQIGISVAPMLAGLGVAGFIIGFALQDVLGNFAAGAMILAYRPFDMGDYIQVVGVEGTVKKMNMVSTTVNTIDNQTLIIPNSKIWGDVIRNYTGQQTRRVDLVFGVSYDDDIEKVDAILHDILAQQTKILDEPAPMIRLHRFAESSVDFIVRPWVRTEDYWETYWSIHKAVKLRFDAENITIPFPQRDVHLYNELRREDS